MSMFINGLKYVQPCQSQHSRQSIDELLTEQYKTISTTVKSCLNDNRMLTTDRRAQQAFSELELMIKDFKLKNISKRLRRRAHGEYKVVRSVQHLLRQRTDVIICRVDKMKTFYFGKTAIIIAKAQEYMAQTEAYQEMTDNRSPLANILRAIQTVLNYVVRTKGLTEAQRKKLEQKSNKLELAHFHGLPKTHKVGTPLRPIIASIYAPTTLISKLLNNLLAPIYLQVAREVTFINDIDVVRTLEQYAANGHLKSTTKFIIADVKNLYTMIPRQGALEALARFLEKYSCNGKIGTLTIDHIMKMARLVLDNNYFVYNNKYYRQVRGGAMGSAFTQVLANIYMFEWEQDLIQHQKRHKEIYRRFIDDMFMTTNQTIEEINVELVKAQNKDKNIQIEPTISVTVNFLDLTITNENGQLRTSIYHKPTAEPYILPYTSDHPHHIHRNIPYAALLRATRLCSHVDDFNSERIRIDMSLLLNEYPPYFIKKQFNRFFQLNNAMSVFEKLDQTIYQQLHRKLLSQSTRREKQLQTSMQDPIKFPEVLKTRYWDSSIMYPKYIFDSSLTINFPKAFYQWWQKHYVYPELPAKNVRIKLIAKTNRTLEHTFVHKKPSRELLTKIEPLPT